MRDKLDLMPDQDFYDRAFMQRAIELAKCGRFTTSPNPNVGCVIIKNNGTIGEGYHHKAGEPHAEVNALKMASRMAKGATVYVTLEPCSHFGRTPPCAHALVAAQVKRVVIAMLDPNPLVAGKGVAILRQAGIEVDVGLLSEQAESINKGFLTRMRTGLPYVQLKMACSLDGKIAMASGESKWITSKRARQDVQLYRAQASAILSTSVTVLADCASLTVRWPELPQVVQAVYPAEQIRQPLRVLIDSQNRLTGNEPIFTQAGEIWLVKKQQTARSVRGVARQLLDESAVSLPIDLPHLLKQLGEQQINSVWVEAGAHLAGALIEQDLVDELIIYMAPTLLGHAAQDLCILPHLSLLANAPHFTLQSVEKIGDDVKLVLHR